MFNKKVTLILMTVLVVSFFAVHLIFVTEWEYKANIDIFLGAFFEFFFVSVLVQFFHDRHKKYQEEKQKAFEEKVIQKLNEIQSKNLESN